MLLILKLLVGKYIPMIAGLPAFLNFSGFLQMKLKIQANPNDSDVLRK